MIWKPTASLPNLRKRAELLRCVREFMHDRDVLEVEAPMISQAGGQDVNIELISAGDRWLNSSPEFPLKRALAAGYGDVYSLQRVFRAGESGTKHNNEFTMLEWYRVGFELDQLMSEVEQLCSRALSMPSSERISYRQLFIQHVDIDPFVDFDAISSLGQDLSGMPEDALERDGWLDIIFSHQIEPRLTDPTFIFNFPESQAALSRVEVVDGHLVARRFELVWQGVELANGYHELNNCDEQLARFERDRVMRARRSQPIYPLDQRFLAAVDELPDCCGVAMGVDRMAMLACDSGNIADVLLFPDRLS